MNQCTPDNENFEQLIFAIRRKKCILMLGPDASVEQVNGTPVYVYEIQDIDFPLKNVGKSGLKNI